MYYDEVNNQNSGWTAIFLESKFIDNLDWVMETPWKFPERWAFVLVAILAACDLLVKKVFSNSSTIYFLFIVEIKYI